MAVTNEKFVNLAGNVCPKCKHFGWEAFETIGPLKEIDSTTIARPTRCKLCGHEFNTIFEITRHGPI